MANEKIVRIKNISGFPIPKHEKACEYETMQNVVDGENVRSRTFCKDCAVPQYDSKEFRFKKDEEIIVTENIARHFENSNQWRKHIRTVGKPQEVLNVLQGKDSSMLFRMEEGVAVPLKIETAEPRIDPREKIDAAMRAGRFISEATDDADEMNAGA